jgi:hypothetical protein
MRVMLRSLKRSSYSLPKGKYFGGGLLPAIVKNAA